MTTIQKDVLMLEALGIENRSDFNQHFPNREATVENLYKYYMEYGQGALYANQD